MHDATIRCALNCKVYDSLADLPEHFQSLFERAGKASLYFTFPWFQNYVQNVLAPTEHLRIYAVETATEPRAACAVLPMYYRDPGASWFHTRTLNGLSNYYSSLFGPVLDQDASKTQESLKALATAIARDKIRWDVINLHPLSTDAPEFEGLIAAFRKAGLLAQPYFCFGNWYLPANNQTFQAYLATRPSRISKTGKRQRRILEAGGQFRFELFSSTADLDRGIADYNKIYNSSWKKPEPYPDFMGGLILRCAEQGWLRLGIGYIDGQPAAAQLWIVANGTASIYKMAYDARFTKHSVGTVLSMRLMEYVIEVDKVEVVDYLTGDDPYKRDWMTHRRERWGIVIFNLRTPYGLFAALRHLSGRAAKHVIDFVRKLRASKI